MQILMRFVHFPFSFSKHYGEGFTEKHSSQAVCCSQGGKTLFLPYNEVKSHFHTFEIRYL